MNIAQAFEHILRAQKAVVLDGGLATRLEAMGCDLHHALWSAKILLEQPKKIFRAHLEFLRAGADCIVTSSYQATPQGFQAAGLPEARAEELLRLTVDLAARAREEFWAREENRRGRARPLIGASIGSYGAFLADGSEYRGDFGMSEGELMDFHRPRLRILAAQAADCFACETIPSIAEASALARLLEEFPDREAWISFSCRDSRHLSSGEPAADAANALKDSKQVVAVGVNCTAPLYVAGLIGEFRRGAPGKKIVVYPNSGETYDAGTKRWDGGECAGFSEMATEWVSAGAGLVGGCCRTTPEDIRKIAEWARK